jgi:hypothetical protein
MKLPANKADWPAEWKELWNERAGIMEYDGKMPRQQAEREAEADIRRIVERNFLNT